MAKASKAQREILGLMVQGHLLIEVPPTWLRVGGRIVQLSTLAVLRRERWIEQVEHRYWRKRAFQITDAGQEAVNEKP